LNYPDVIKLSSILDTGDVKRFFIFEGNPFMNSCFGANLNRPAPAIPKAPAS
jgi:hypothetical protein